MCAENFKHIKKQQGKIYPKHCTGDSSYIPLKEGSQCPLFTPGS